MQPVVHRNWTKEAGKRGERFICAIPFDGRGCCRGRKTSVALPGILSCPECGSPMNPGMCFCVMFFDFIPLRRELQGKLQRSRSHPGSVSESELIDTIKEVSELMVFGDKHADRFFEFFCEKSMMRDFHALLRCGFSNAVRIQIFQTVMILLQNIRNERSLCYLLSNNQVNNLIEDGQSVDDEELVAYYISLLKALSLTLNETTIHFFLVTHPPPDRFPLYSCAVRYFNHPESMVRTSVRAITLNVFRVREPGVARFVCEGPESDYPLRVVLFLRDHVIRLSDALGGPDHPWPTRKLRRPAPSGFGTRAGLAASRARPSEPRMVGLPASASSLFGEMLDQLYYIADVLECGIDGLSETLSVALLDFVVRPLLLHSIRALAYPDAVPVPPDAPVTRRHESSSGAVVDPAVAMLCLALCFRVLREGNTAETIAAELLGAPLARDSPWVPSSREFVDGPGNDEDAGFSDSRATTWDVLLWVIRGPDERVATTGLALLWSIGHSSAVSRSLREAMGVLPPDTSRRTRLLHALTTSQPEESGTPVRTPSTAKSVASTGHACASRPAVNPPLAPSAAPSGNEGHGRDGVRTQSFPGHRGRSRFDSTGNDSFHSEPRHMRPVAGSAPESRLFTEPVHDEEDEETAEKVDNNHKHDSADNGDQEAFEEEADGDDDDDDGGSGSPMGEVSAAAAAARSPASPFPESSGSASPKRSQQRGQEEEGASPHRASPHVGDSGWVPGPLDVSGRQRHNAARLWRARIRRACLVFLARRPPPREAAVAVTLSILENLGDMSWAAGRVQAEMESPAVKPPTGGQGETENDGGGQRPPQPEEEVSASTNRSPPHWLVPDSVRWILLDAIDSAIRAVRYSVNRPKRVGGRASLLAMVEGAVWRMSNADEGADPDGLFPDLVVESAKLLGKAISPGDTVSPDPEWVGPGVVVSAPGNLARGETETRRDAMRRMSGSGPSTPRRSSPAGGSHGGSDVAHRDLAPLEPPPSPSVSSLDRVALRTALAPLPLAYRRALTRTESFRRWVRNLLDLRRMLFRAFHPPLPDAFLLRLRPPLGSIRSGQAFTLTRHQHVAALLRTKLPPAARVAATPSSPRSSGSTSRGSTNSPHSRRMHGAVRSSDGTLLLGPNETAKAGLNEPAGPNADGMLAWVVVGNAFLVIAERTPPSRRGSLQQPAAASTSSTQRQAGGGAAAVAPSETADPQHPPPPTRARSESATRIKVRAKLVAPLHLTEAAPLPSNRRFVSVRVLSETPIVRASDWGPVLCDSDSDSDGNEGTEQDAVIGSSSRRHGWRRSVGGSSTSSSFRWAASGEGASEYAPPQSRQQLEGPRWYGFYLDVGSSEVAEDLANRIELERDKIIQQREEAVAHLLDEQVYTALPHGLLEEEDEEDNAVGDETVDLGRRTNEEDEVVNNSLSKGNGDNGDDDGDDDEQQGEGTNSKRDEDGEVAAAGEGVDENGSSSDGGGSKPQGEARDVHATGVEGGGPHGKATGKEASRDSLEDGHVGEDQRDTG